MIDLSLNPPPGSWPHLRRDLTLSGHQSLSGAVSHPGVAWRHYLGGPLFDAHSFALDGDRRFCLIFGGCIHCYGPDGVLCWKSIARGFEGLVGICDIDDDGRTEIVATNGKSIFVLDALTGAILWQEYLGPPFAAGFMHTGALLHRFPAVGSGMQLAIGLLSSREVVLYDFTPGAAAPERRHILWMDDFFHPSILAADVDGDGHDELIVTKYAAIFAFDPATGAEKSVCQWSSGGTPKRNYGLFLARDISGDGLPDFVVLSNRVSKHIAVVENNGRGDLHNRWDRFVEHIYPTDEKELRYCFSSCCDVDGDGAAEIIVSLFNDDGDGRWWLEVLDAWTGDVRLRMPDLYLHGIEIPTDGGLPYLFCSRELNRQPSEFGSIGIYRWDEESLGALWRHDRAGFVGRFRSTDHHTTTFRTELPPSDDVWCVDLDGVTAVPLLLNEGTLRLLMLRNGEWDEQTVSVSDVVVSVLAVEDLDGDGETELLVSTDDGQIVALGLDGHERFRISGGMRPRPGTGPYYMAKPMQTPTVLDGFCAVPDGGDRVHLLQWDSDLSSPEIRWVMKGKGEMGPEEAFHAVPFDTYHEFPVLLIGNIGDGRGLLCRVALDGTVMDRRSFPEMSASPSVPPGRIGLYSMLPVKTAERSFLILSGYASASMNSERTCCLDAESGVVVWERRLLGNGEDGRGFGPWNAPSLVPDAPTPQILFLAKDTVCHVDATTGEFLHEPWQLRPYNTRDLQRRTMTMDDFSAYGSLIPVDVDGDGRCEWLVAAAYGGIGVIAPDHSMRWWLSAPLSSLTGGFPGVADVDGDGLPEIGASYADGDFVCMRADTGSEKWRLHLGVTASGVVSCDIDGDGRNEFILATQEGILMAVGVSTSGCGLIKWRIDLGYSLGPPIIADFNGDGRSEILVVAGDGYVYGIDDSR